jgi:hypothetical protein
MSPRTPSFVTLAVVAAVTTVAGNGLMACSSGSQGDSPHGGGSGPADSGADGEDFVPTAETFDCLKDGGWTQVGASMFKNVLGHTDEMLAIARSPDGGTFPVGTVVQLIPTEASVKRGQGYSAASRDWEFFSLGVASTGSTIKTSGGDAHVVNAFGGSCLGCHGQAAPQWDLVCGDADGGNTHGCASLPLTGPELASLRSSDPRCP